MTLETRMGGKIAIVGGLNMDLFIQGERLPNPGETFEGRSFSTGGGGKGANQAVGVARLARNSGTAVMIGQVGDDPFGRELVSSMEAEGIDCGFTRVDASQSSGVALIFIDNTAENYVLPVYGANATCGPKQVEDFSADGRASRCACGGRGSGVCGVSHTSSGGADGGCAYSVATGRGRDFSLRTEPRERQASRRNGSLAGPADRGRRRLRRCPGGRGQDLCARD